MADNDPIKLRIEAEFSDLDKVNAKLRVLQTAVKDLDYQFRKGTISAEQLKSGLATVQTEAGKLNLSYKQQIDLGASVYQVTQRAEVGFKSLGTSLNDINNTLKGKAIPALTSFGQIVQDMPYGVRGVANNVTQLVSQFGYLSSSAGGAGGAIKAMMGAMLGPAGILVGVSLISSLAVAFGDKLIPKIKSADELMKSMVDSAKELARGGIAGLSESRAEAERIGFEKQLAQAETDLAGLKSSKLITRKVDIPGVPFPLTFTARGTAGTDTEIRDAEKRVATLKAYVQQYRDYTDALRQANAEELRAAGSRYEEEIATGRIDANIAKGGIGLSARAASLLGATGGKRGRIYNVDEGDRIPLVAEFNAADRAWLGFASSVESGIDAMVASVPSIGTAFAKAFGGAKTMLGSFVQAFTSAMQELAIKAAALFVLSKIPGIGPLVGAIGTRAGGGPVNSGQPYLVGERGPELFVPKVSGKIVPNMYPSRAAMAGAPIVLETRIRGNDLVLVQAKASQSRRGRTM